MPLLCEVCVRCVSNVCVCVCVCAGILHMTSWRLSSRETTVWPPQQLTPLHGVCMSVFDSASPCTKCAHAVSAVPTHMTCKDKAYT